jgi:hypothetical protein
VTVMVGGQGRIASLLIGLVGLQLEVGVGSALVVAESDVGDLWGAAAKRQEVVAKLEELWKQTDLKGVGGWWEACGW